MLTKLRVAVLGAGTWARGAHIPGWLRDPRSEVVAVCDVERERAEAYASEFGIPEASNDWQAVVGRSDIDVIDIVSPSHTHYELACAALEAGKHVLCEKPVAYDFRQTRAAAQTARQNGSKRSWVSHSAIALACSTRARCLTKASSARHSFSMATSRTRSGLIRRSHCGR